MHRSQKKLVLVNGGFAGEPGIDTNLYEGGRRGTKRMFEEYDKGKLCIHLYKNIRLRTKLYTFIQYSCLFNPVITYLNAAL